ncbi:MAG: hypothetical protein PHF83_06570 [Candidatus Methanomethylophilus sp.]|nr:hypothetical protein [Methanomethylophilus sp.]
MPYSATRMAREYNRDRIRRQGTSDDARAYLKDSRYDEEDSGNRRWQYDDVSAQEAYERKMWDEYRAGALADRKPAPRPKRHRTLWPGRKRKDRKPGPGRHRTVSGQPRTV